MRELTSIGKHIPATSPAVASRISELEDYILSNDMPVSFMDTDHVFHAGMYARTITIPAGVLLTGALIKIPTLLIVSGNAEVFTGEGWIHVEGYHVIAGSAGRKQMFVANSDTALTMIFASDSQTTDEAEQQFTDEFEKLFSRKEGFKNTITVTGE